MVVERSDSQCMEHEQYAVCGVAASGQRGALRVTLKGGGQDLVFVSVGVGLGFRVLRHVMSETTPHSSDMRAASCVRVGGGASEDFFALRYTSLPPRPRSCIRFLRCRSQSLYRHPLQLIGARITCIISVYSPN